MPNGDSDIITTANKYGQGTQYDLNDTENVLRLVRQGEEGVKKIEQIRRGKTTPQPPLLRGTTTPVEPPAPVESDIITAAKNFSTKLSQPIFKIPDVTKLTPIEEQKDILDIRPEFKTIVTKEPIKPELEKAARNYFKDYDKRKKDYQDLMDSQKESDFNDIIQGVQNPVTAGTLPFYQRMTKDVIMPAVEDYVNSVKDKYSSVGNILKPDVKVLEKGLNLFSVPFAVQNEMIKSVPYVGEPVSKSLEGTFGLIGETGQIPTKMGFELSKELGIPLPTEFQNAVNNVAGTLSQFVAPALLGHYVKGFTGHLKDLMKEEEAPPEVSLKILEKNLRDIFEEPREFPKFEQEFKELSKSTSLKEKPGDITTYTTEQRQALESGDWRKFSELRGYTPDEINGFQRYMDKYNEGKKLGYTDDELASLSKEAEPISDIIQKANEVKQRIEPQIEASVSGLPDFPTRDPDLLKSEIVPGLSMFIKEIGQSLPEKKGILESLKKTRGTLVNWFKPDVIKETVSSQLAKTLSTIANRKDMLWDAVDKRRVWWDYVPQDVKYSFIDKIEKGNIEPKDFEYLGKDKASTFSDIAKEYRKRMEGRFEEEKTFNDKLSYIENYFPRLWEKPEQVESWIMGYTSKLGKPKFMKHRFFEFFKSALDAGFKPITDNPEELMLHREFGSFQYTEMKRFLNLAKDTGLLKFNRGRIPDGWSEINSNAMKVYFKSMEENMPIRAGQYIMPSSGARIVNNYLEPSLWGNKEWYGKLFRTAMGLKNATVSFKLGLSAFHGISTTLSDISEQIVRAEREVLNGNYTNAVKEFAKAPVSPLIDVYQGGDFIRAWYKGAKNDYEQAGVDIMKRGGFRPRMGEEFRPSLRNNLRRSIAQIQTEHPLGAMWSLAKSTPELIAYPILDFYVPRLKTMTYLKQAGDFIRDHPDMPELKQDIELKKLANNADDNFGQMVYDNLFWHRVVRDITTGSSLSLGWNLGTIRKFTGGAKDIGSAFFKEGPISERITNRTLGAITYPIVVGTLGAVTMYALTGKWPSELIDYYYPKTGAKNDDGSDERLAMPSMMKEFFTSSKEIRSQGPVFGTAKYIGSKVTPVFSTVWDMLNNRDFYGINIRNPKDPLLNQLMQEGSFILQNSFEPISLSSQKRLKREGLEFMPFLGFNPAPKYITNTILQNQIEELYRERFPQGTRQRSDKEIKDVKAKIREALKKGDEQTADDLGSEAEVNGLLTKGEIQYIHRNYNVPFEVSLFKQLPKMDQLDFIDSMDEVDKNKFIPYVSGLSEQMTIEGQLLEKSTRRLQQDAATVKDQKKRDELRSDAAINKIMLFNLQTGKMKPEDVRAQIQQNYDFKAEFDNTKKNVTKAFNDNDIEAVKKELNYLGQLSLLVPDPDLQARYLDYMDTVQRRMSDFTPSKELTPKQKKKQQKIEERIKRNIYIPMQ